MRNRSSFALPTQPDRLPDRRRLVGLEAMIALLMAVGCIHDPTIGPLYSDAPAPGKGFTRVYLYRVDPHHSFSIVEIRFDDETPVHILDEEYLTHELREGTHEIAFRLRRRLGLPSPKWRKQVIRARSGETLYFEIAVGVSERTPPPGRETEVAGRVASGLSGEVASMRLRSEREALDRLRLTHLHVP